MADRPCPALDWANGHGLATVLIEDIEPAAFDRRLAEALAAAEPDVVVLAGFMRIVGPQTLAAFGGRMLNVHPSLLPAFPGAHAVRDALAAGVRTTGVTVHIVDEHLDGGPILLQEPVAVLAGDDEASLLARVHAVEHRLLAQAVLLVGSKNAHEAMLPPRRALLSVSDKTGLADFASGLAALGYELVSTGGTAQALRSAGLEVTDVAALSGAAEMLDGRVKTLHPGIHGGILADRTKASHRAQLAAAAIAPFELVVVNLYPFAQAAEKPGISLAALVEEIDIGGPAMVRASAKNFASVAVVTSPARYDAVLDSLRETGEVPLPLRAALAIEAFRHVAAYDARIVAELPRRMAAEFVLPDEPGLPGATDPFPATLPLAFEKVETLRYGENPHQVAALYRRPGTARVRGPFAGGAEQLQGKALSYNNVLDTTAVAALARDLHAPACAIVKHTNPCGAAERADLATAWEAALAGDPVSAFGGVVAFSGTVDGPLAERLAAIFLEVVIAVDFTPEARQRLSSKSNLRLLIYPELATPDLDTDALADLRSAGGALLVGSADVALDDPARWTVATSRTPTGARSATSTWPGG